MNRSVVWLIAANAVVFIIQNLVGGFTGAFVLHDIAQNPYTIISSMFLHGSLFHLLSNMFALFLFGLLLEHEIGTKRFLAIYFMSGIIAGIAGSLLYPSLLGASGAIFGIMGYLAAIKPRLTVWTYGVPMPMAVAAAFWLVLDAAGVFYPSDIANLSHIAGLLFGAAPGLYSIRNRPKKEQQKRRYVSEEDFRKWEDVWMGREKT